MSKESRKEKLIELIDGEVTEYGIDYEIEESEDYSDEEDCEYYNISADFLNKKRDIFISIDKDNKIEVELCEDSWVEIESYNRTIKYFWMTFLGN